MTTVAYDWRQDYALCEHIAAEPDKDKALQMSHHKGFRVCCAACLKLDFFDRDDYQIKKVGRFTAMSLDPQVKS